MFSWRSIQQLKYFSLVVGVILLVVAAGAYVFLNRPGSCSDGKQNNGELSVDCGGACSRLCPFEVSDVIAHWARSFHSRGETYDAVAFLENPNIGAGVREISYVFRLYDAQNVLTGEREGKTFVNPKEQFAVYESGITAGAGTHAPQRTFFEIKSEPYWENIATPRESELAVSDILFEKADGVARVMATLKNRTLQNFKDLEVAALLFDDEENLIDASKTTVARLAAGEAKLLIFLLSEASRETPKHIDIFPRRNMFK